MKGAVSVLYSSNQSDERDTTHPSDLVVTSDDWVEFAVLGELGEILTVLLEMLSGPSLAVAFVGVLRVDTPARPKGLELVKQRLDREGEGGEDRSN